MGACVQQVYKIIVLEITRQKISVLTFYGLDSVAIISITMIMVGMSWSW